MGIGRVTIYHHMEEHGIPTARKEWSELTDDELDEVVSEISLTHPFVSTAIVMGHLKARQLHVPRARIQESLRRVDRTGVYFGPQRSGTMAGDVSHFTGELNGATNLTLKLNDSGFSSEVQDDTCVATV
jgi:hypothetical protein